MATFNPDDVGQAKVVAATGNGELQSVIDFAKDTLPAEQLDIERDGVTAKLIVMPRGRQLVDLSDLIDKQRQVPDRRKGVANLSTLDSLIEHANRFKDSDSALFANPDPKMASITAVLNYHRAGEGGPRFGDHRGVYCFPLSESWKTWLGCDSTFMKQADFAAFLEDNIIDVADPAQAGESSQLLADKLEVKLATPSALMSAARGLSLKVEHTVKSTNNLSTGEVVVLFEEKHSGDSGGKVSVPSAFLLGIPVFRSGDFFDIAARLRYRCVGGTVSFAYSLHRADRVFDHAFGEACTKAAKLTALPLYMGAPELTR